MYFNFQYFYKKLHSKRKKLKLFYFFIHFIKTLKHKIKINKLTYSFFYKNHNNNKLNNKPRYSDIITTYIIEDENVLFIKHKKHIKIETKPLKLKR